MIDVGSQERSPRLYASNGAPGKWVALSYCWGGSSEFILTRATQEKFVAGVPLEEFPATLRDAIVATRALGIRYIWIDALCILQDSSDDWFAEAPKMGQIYTNAEVVIAATASDDVQAGLFRASEVPRSIRVPWTSVGDDTGHRPIPEVGIHSLDDQINVFDKRRKSDRWGTRGWTMQEDLLATRILSFTKEHTTWECISKKTSVDGRPFKIKSEQFGSRQYITRYVTRMVSSRVTGKSFPNLEMFDYGDMFFGPDKDVQGMWYKIVELYSRRQLTQNSDRLPALAGLATYFKQHLGDDYCAGLWKEDLIYGLTWVQATSGLAALCEKMNLAPDPAELSSLENPEARDVVAPTWSWVSMDAALEPWHLRKTGFEKPPAEVVDVRIDLVRDDAEFGGIRGGTLVLRAPFLTFSLDAPGTDGTETNIQTAFRKELTGDGRANNIEFRTRHRPYPGQKFVGLHLWTEEMNSEGSYVPGSFFFLLLESVRPDPSVDEWEEEVHENIKFIRIGVKRLYEPWEWGPGRDDKIVPTPGDSYGTEFADYAAYVGHVLGRDIPRGTFTIV